MLDEEVESEVRNELIGEWDHVCRLWEQESEGCICLSSPDDIFVRRLEGRRLDCHDIEVLNRDLVCTCHESGDLVFASGRSYGCPHDEYIAAMKCPESTLRRVCRHSESLEECRRRLRVAADSAHTGWWLPRGILFVRALLSKLSSSTPPVVLQVRSLMEAAASGGLRKRRKRRGCRGSRRKR